MVNPRRSRKSSERNFPPSPRDLITPARPRLPSEKTPYRRGEMVVRVPVTPKDLEQVGVRVVETGLMEWPRYQTKGGELGELVQLPQITLLRGFSKIERRAMKRFMRVSGEIARLDGLAERVMAIHNNLVKKGFPSPEIVEKRLIPTLQTLHKLIEARSRKKSKKAALIQFEDAIAFTKIGNWPACVQSLKGIVFNLRLRVSALNRQYPRLERQQGGSIDTRKKYQELAKHRIQEIEWVIHQLSLPRLPSLDLARLAASFDGNANEFVQQKKVDSTSEGNALARRYEELTSILSSGKLDRGSVQRRLATIRQLLYVRYARNFIVPSTIFRETARWPPTVRQRIIDFQLGLVKDNLDVWRKYGNPIWIAPWLLSVANSMAADSSFRERQRRIVEASVFMRQGKPERVVESLEKALTTVH